MEKTDTNFVICHRDDLVSMMADALKYWALRDHDDINESEHEWDYKDYMCRAIELLDKDELEYFDGHKATETEITNNEKLTFEETAELIINNSPAYDCINIGIAESVCHGCDLD